MSKNILVRKLKGKDNFGDLDLDGSPRLCLCVVVAVVLV